MRAREVVAAALVTLTAACAAQDVGEPAAPPPAPLDAPAPLSPEPVDLERAGNDDDLGLAEYERLLADKEARLRAAGVLLAARDRGGEEARGDAAYAPPAPPAPLTAARGDDRATAKATESKTVGRGVSGGGLAATPEGTSAPAKRPTESARERNARAKKKEVAYNPAPQAAPAADFSAAAAESEPGARCQNICDLSAATCDLEGKICDLASRHPDDPRYADLCRRADDDCRLAAEACQRCSP